ncbi:hypothetical protein L1049_009879 [Liquidambar formosana]|uniref:Bromo domain-containing protein n=1 Tax=Liquidambar formosana TaxID=63359 RepID=A0AAP0N6J2_LIQFO
MEEEMMMVWGTWEELLLAGAVLRHGTGDWDAVALELRERTLYPYSFTSEACKAKYEDLQQHHSGCIALFEELRKQRMEELKRSLEQSDDSIGSLQSKLETLKSEKGDDCHVGNGSSQTESSVPFQKSEGVESSSKETSKDGLSAGSFTQETRTNWSPERQIPAAVLAGEMETKPEISGSSGEEKVPSIENLAEAMCSGQGGSFRKKRGKRKRKDCNRDVKEEVSVGESDFLGSSDVITASWCKENPISECSPIVTSSGANDCNQGSSGQGIDDLMGIFNSVVENEKACVFRRRLDSQKRGRYKKLVRQHMDFDTIRSRIASCSITSSRQLFRDLLLLTSNALIFYSKKSREHKSAQLLRDLTTNLLWQHYKGSSNNAATAILSRSPMPNPPVKPRSVRPCNRKLSGKVTNAGHAVAGTSQGGKKPSNADSHPAVDSSVPMAKKGSSWQGKVGRRTAGLRPETPTRGRKKARGR